MIQFLLDDILAFHHTLSDAFVNVTSITGNKRISDISAGISTEPYFSPIISPEAPKKPAITEIMADFFIADVLL